MNYLFLTKTAFFYGLSENEIKTILNCFGAYQKSFKKSEIIYYSGDTVSDMGLVLSGSVNIVVNYYWGSSNIFNHIGQGEISPKLMRPFRIKKCSVMWLRQRKRKFCLLM